MIVYSKGLQQRSWWLWMSEQVTYDVPKHCLYWWYHESATHYVNYQLNLSQHLL